MLRSLSLRRMWPELPYPKRAEQAAHAGFDLVELWDPVTCEADKVADVCRSVGIGINGFFGNRGAGLCDPEARPQALREIRTSLDVAADIGARQLHLFSNAIVDGNVVATPKTLSHEDHVAAASETLRAAADWASDAGVTLILEHLNTVFLPGYLWSDALDVVEVANRVDHPAVRIAFDAFHQQLTWGRLTDRLVASLPVMARFDIAEVPDRVEPGAGEIDFHYLRKVIDDHGWDGTLTFECAPSDGDPTTALRAIDEYFPRDWCMRPRAVGEEK